MSTFTGRDTVSEQLRIWRCWSRGDTGQRGNLGTDRILDGEHVRVLTLEEEEFGQEEALQPQLRRGSRGGGGLGGRHEEGEHHAGEVEDNCLKY